MSKLWSGKMEPHSSGSTGRTHPGPVPESYDGSGDTQEYVLPHLLHGLGQAAM